MSKEKRIAKKYSYFISAEVVVVVGATEDDHQKINNAIGEQDVTNETFPEVYKILKENTENIHRAQVILDFTDMMNLRELIPGEKSQFGDPETNPELGT